MRKSHHDDKHEAHASELSRAMSTVKCRLMGATAGLEADDKFAVQYT